MAPRQSTPIENQTEPAEEASNYTVQAIDTAVGLLLLIGDNPDLGLSELSRRSGTAKARVYRQLCTLEGRGLVVCDPQHRTYRLGLTMLLLGNRAAEQLDVVAVAKPYLAMVGEQFQETVQLRALQGDETICIASWEPSRPLQVNGRVGLRRPLYAGSGKIVLAHLPHDHRERILSGKLERFTAGTQTDVTLLRSELDTIKRDGYIVSRGEINEGLISIAVPLVGAGASIWGAINLAAPALRMDTTKIEAVVTTLKMVAKKMYGTLQNSSNRNSATAQRAHR